MIIYKICPRLEFHAQGHVICQTVNDGWSQVAQFTSADWMLDPVFQIAVYDSDILVVS